MRIVLNLKNPDFDIHPISLVEGEQRTPGYLEINPQGLVQFLVDGELGIGQSSDTGVSGGAIPDSADSGLFCAGATATIADACLIPQVYNARRFHVPLYDYPRIRSIDTHYRALEAFSKAAPETQTE